MHVFVPSRFRLQSVRSLFLAAGLLLSSSAAADLVPSPIPECVGKPDGTFCKLADGTAGQCTTNQDTRRPGRSWQSCNKDPKECDRLAIGAECHGYLGKPSHCREFSDPDKGTKWRTCQADDVNSAAAPAAAAPAAPAPAAPAAATPAAEAPPAKKGMFSCSAAPGAGSTGTPLAGLSLLGLSLLGLFGLRRSRRTA